MLGFILAVITVVAVLFIWAFIVWINDKRKWNKGKCKCGTKWRYFDVDSHSARGYMCDDCGKSIWISYNLD